MKKRAVSLYIALCVMLSGILYRIISLNYSAYADAGTGYSSKTLLIGETRGNIYDVNLRKIVNSSGKLICAAKPGAYSLAYIKNIEDKEKSKSLAQQLTKGLPVIFETDKKISTEDMETFSVPQRYEDNNFLCHLTGYLDTDGHGVSGIENAYDTFLSAAGGSLSVTFETDANGKVLSGIVPRVEDNNFDTCEGVVLTIDSEIQKIAESAMKQCEIKSGACVILSANDASVAAMVSTPSFDRKNIAASLNSPDSPLVNKALSAYAVGSVFKPVIACAALESGIKSFETDCTGQTDINGTHYGCNRQTAHGKMNLKTALEVSCNTYFVNLAQKLKSSSFYDFCMNMGFSAPTRFCDGIYSEGGTFPEERELDNKGIRANISFGQGSLTATPVQLAAAYLAIADGGLYKYPYLIKGTLDKDGVFNPTQRKPDSRVISKSTCDIMRENLISVVENGNAYNAQCSLCTTAGKTGTAQSGSFDENGREILRTWFVGYFPANEPLYSVAILNENGTSGAADCAPVFSLIAQRTMELMIERAN